MLTLPKKSKIFIKAKLTVGLVDSLQKSPTRACLFRDFLHFKGCSYINHKISLQYDLYSEYFLAFHNLFTMLDNMEVHLKWYFSMRIQSKF